MKNKLIRLIQYIAHFDILWYFLKPISKAGVILKNARSQKVISNLKNTLFDQTFTSQTVLNGPFKGLKYPSLDSVGYVIYPKLLGSYERELQPVISSLAKNHYSEIIDIGCAEGYYAIGLARIFASAEVHAYDINKRALELCQNMAKENNVLERVHVNTVITSEVIGNFKFKEKGLIVSDCEGFEVDLFNENNLKNLLNCDLIIELHDFIDLEISVRLKKLFSKTHNLESVYSSDDIYKSHNYDYPELSRLSLGEKMEILRERRPAIMEWLICRSKE
jgi:hypothetical protein